MGQLTTGVTIVILLISLMLIGVTVAQSLDGTTEEDYNQMVSEIIDGITSYIQIKDTIGKYYDINGVKKIEKIAIWISPWVSQEIDMSQLTIQLCNGETVKILTYDGNAEYMGSNSLFEHPIWNNITGTNFGFISIVDLDGSLVNYDTINEKSDNAYVLIRLPEDMTLAKGESITIILFPSTGITTMLEDLKAPLPMKSVVTFE